MNNDNKLINKLVSRAKLYLVLIALLLIKICMEEKNLIIPAIILYIAIVIYTLWVDSKKKSEIESHIEEVAIGMNFAVRNYLNKSPLPLIVIETDGNVIFKSPRFVKEFSNLAEDIDINTYLESIIKEIKLEIENKDKKEITKQITIENKIYKIFCEYSVSRKRDKRKRKEYVLTLYFIDDTKYHSLLNVEKINDEYIYGKNDLFALLIIIRQLLTQNEVKNLILEIEHVLNNLEYNLKSISIDKVLDRMGFPPNWKDIADIEIGG